MRHRSFAVLSIAAVAAGAWYLLREPEPLPQAESRAAAPAAVAATTPSVPATPERLSAAAVLSIDPRRVGNTRLPPPAPTLFNEYLSARHYRAIYDRLQGSPEGQTAEGRLVLYEILRQCATITEGRRPGYQPRNPSREEFLAGLPATDPQREKRIAAFEEFTANRCAGFEGLTMTRADLMKVLQDAAAMGDPRARALAMEQELWDARRAGGGGWRGNRDGGVTLSDTQVETIKQLAATRDPEAIRVAGRMLANSWHDYALRVGPDQEPVEPRAFMNAWLVVACEYGAPCGADSPRLLQACAMQGHCDAMNFPDYLYYYGSSPHDSQLLVRYRALVRDALETGNWSQLSVVRGQPPANNRLTFVPGPR